MAAAGTFSTTAPDRHGARRTRAICRGNPAALRGIVAGSLASAHCTPRLDVAAANHSAARIDWSDSAILGHRTPEARAFADVVAANLVAGILPQSARNKLLAEARRRRLGDFEANLIIAAVQYRLGSGRKSAEPGKKKADRLISRSTLSFLRSKFAVFLLLEVLIAASVWLMFY